jgi:hypothetical protein
LLLIAGSWQVVRTTRPEREVRASVAPGSSLRNEDAQARDTAATGLELARDAQARAAHAQDELAFELYRIRIATPRLGEPEV